jgi:hypothetical protein
MGLTILVATQQIEDRADRKRLAEYQRRLEVPSPGEA